jgi:ABC-2 type transport system permease protein
MFMGSILLIAIQLWAALRFRSFVPPLVLGISGTFVAVAATSAKEGPYFPWLIPTNALASDPARANLAIQIGLYGGLVLLGLMVVRMSRVEVR